MPELFLRAASLLMVVASSVAAVVAPHAVARPGSAEGGVRAVVRPAAAVTALPYAFESISGGVPVHLSSCVPVHWWFNPAGAPRGGLAVVQSAFARLSAVTGVHFAYDGATPTVPRRSYVDDQQPGGWRPVLVGWVRPEATDLLDGPRVVGFTRNKWYGTPGRALVRTGVVALNASRVLPLTGPLSWQAVVLHELGHLAGLAHVDDPDELMSPTLPRGLSGYGPGDLAGLRRLGGEGC